MVRRSFFNILELLDDERKYFYKFIKIGLKVEWFIMNFCFGGLCMYGGI